MCYNLFWKVVKIIKHRKLLSCILISSLLLTSVPIANISHHAPKASANATAYDMSQYQGYLTKNQVKHLKHEVAFVIVRAQAYYPDAQIKHNIKLLTRYHVPYGVYSYSYYTNVTSAKREARNLHALAPHAKFYVNDCEENDAGYRLNRATYAWSKTMKHLTNRPVVLYSGLYFMAEHFTRHTINSYDTTWIADYSMQPRTSIHYDLWQFTDSYYSRALRERLDADDIPSGRHIKPLSFWIGNSYKHHSIKRGSAVKKVHPVKSAVVQRRLNNIAYDLVYNQYYHQGHHKYRVDNVSGLRVHGHHYSKLLRNGVKLHVQKFITKSNGTSIGIAKYHHHTIRFSGTKNILNIA